MPTTTNDATAGSTDCDLTSTSIFALLANERRQFALQYLRRTVGSVAVADLADRIALREGEHTQERYERVATSLVHVHLPKLREAGVIRYDPDGETVELLAAADDLDPFLSLVDPGEE